MTRKTDESDEKWMLHAMSLASRAERLGEVPVGALVVNNEQGLLAEGWNTPIQSNDPSAHAEVNAIRQAATKVGNYRLSGCTLYVTLEPCPMCAGLIVHSRIKRVVFGAWDNRSGAAFSAITLLQHHKLNHRVEVTGGVLSQQCKEQLTQFFRLRRAQKSV